MEVLIGICLDSTPTWSTGSGVLKDVEGGRTVPTIQTQRDGKNLTIPIGISRVGSPEERVYWEVPSRIDLSMVW